MKILRTAVVVHWFGQRFARYSCLMYMMCPIGQLCRLLFCFFRLICIVLFFQGLLVILQVLLLYLQLLYT